MRNLLLNLRIEEYPDSSSRFLSRSSLPGTPWVAKGP